MITRDQIETILRTLPRLTIGLVGDLFLDRYLELVPDSYEVSIETGREAWQIERVRNAPGALGTVLNNLAALGVGLLVPVTVIGDDGHGYDLIKELRLLPLDASNVLQAGDRLTPTYTKPMRLTHGAAGPQWEELNRLDVRTRGPLSEMATAEVCRRLREVFRTSDGLIVLDQLVDENEGVVNEQVRKTLHELAKSDPRKLVFIDSRRYLARFSAGLLKGNRSEVLAAGSSDVGRDNKDDQPALLAATAALARKTGRPAFCTAGERGIVVARSAGQSDLVPGYPAKGPIDVVGAGDAATSGIVCALLSGCDELAAAAFGNLVASVTVEQLGTTGTATPAQVRDRWKEVSSNR
jgi:bifunctional ADP-heptose synthase (sugar kinase/adenylyltransferase)